MVNLMLTQLPEFSTLDKSKISWYANAVLDQIDSGNQSALEWLIVGKKLQELGKKLEDNTRPIAENEIFLGGGEHFIKDNVEIVQKTLGTRIDYEMCNEPEYDSLIKTLAELKDAVKKREKFLLSLQETTTIVNKDGEIITINPPTKYGRVGLSLTIK